MTDPIFNWQQGANPQTTSTDTHQDIFWWSSDVFNNPDMFQPEAPKAAPAEEDFHIDLGQLEASQHVSPASEPIVIEPQIQETFEEYQAKQNPPQPEIIEQVVEPQMKPEVKVNPRKQGAPAPRPQPRPAQVQVQARPQAQIPPRPVAHVVPKPQSVPQAKPQVQAVQVVRPQNSDEYRVPRTASPVANVQATKKPNVDVDFPKSSEVNPPTSVTSDLQRKFTELMNTARNVYTLEKKDTDQILELLWANNDKVTILYQITLPENGISIKKIETDIDTQEEVVTDLWFTIENNSVQVLLDDVLLFDEIEHLQNDPKKKMQVTEKLNKFIFLLSEHQKKAEKEAKEREEAEQERRRLQDIFRNF